ncbi:unnamed protein product [Cylindrotheca closterium]|uniref:SEA domain-containing protein n=1 Tax=Cylindrotheca closterium TaxID=2856 RepID=A0AAD2FZV4_9STRA|nr:unnamed protein product [Cylindrotheca closterium]
MVLRYFARSQLLLVSCLWCFMLLSPTVQAAKPRGSIGIRRREAKENKRDPETSSPTAIPTVIPTASPSIETNPPTIRPTKAPKKEQTEAPTQRPTSQQASRPTFQLHTVNPTLSFESSIRSLTPFVLELSEFPRNETAFNQLVERYLYVSMNAAMATLVNVDLQVLNTDRKLTGLQVKSIRMYHGSVTIRDPSVMEPSAKSAQTAALEDIATLNQFVSSSDIDLLITRVQVGDRDPVSIEAQKQNDATSSSPTPNIGLIVPVSIAVLLIVAATFMLVRYRRNKPPASPPPYVFEEDSDSSVSLDEGIPRFGKSRTIEIETETEQTSPSERASLRRLSSSKFMIQECLAGGGMEVVQLDSDGEDDRIVQLASIPMMSPSQSSIARSHSPSSMSVFSNSNDSTALRSSAMRFGRSRAVESHTDNSSAQLTLDSTKVVGALSMLASSSESCTDDSADEGGGYRYGRMEEPNEDIFVRRDTTRVSPSRTDSQMHQINCTKSEETERRFNPPNKWLAPPRQPPVTPLDDLLDDLLRSDSSTVADTSAMALESVLNPVRHTEEAGNRPIEVFVDSDSASQISEPEEEDYSADSEDGSSEAPQLLLKSVGSIRSADSFSSQQSESKTNLPSPLNLNQKLFGRNSNDQDHEPDAKPRIVSPTTSSHENASDEENDAPSDEETRFLQNRDSFEYSQTGSVHSERDIFDESTLFPTLNSTMDSISYSSSSVASQDSSSQFDPVFLEQLKWEKRRAKAATRKLKSEENQISFAMDL